MDKRKTLQSFGKNQQKLKDYPAPLDGLQNHRLRRCSPATNALTAQNCPKLLAIWGVSSR